MLDFDYEVMQGNISYYNAGNGKIEFRRNGIAELANRVMAQCKSLDDQIATMEKFRNQISGQESKSEWISECFLHLKDPTEFAMEAREKARKK